LFSAAVELLAMSSLFPLFEIVAGNQISERDVISRLLSIVGISNITPGVLFGTFIVLLIVRILSQLLSQSLSVFLGRKVMAQLASNSFDTIMKRLTIQEINQKSIGYYISLAGDESFRASTLIVAICQCFASAALALIYFIAIIQYSPNTAIAVVAFLLISFVSLAGVLRASHRLGGKQIEGSRAAASVFLDSLNNLKAVRAFLSEGYVVSLYKSLVSSYTRTLFWIDEMALLSKMIPILLLLITLAVWSSISSFSLADLGIAFLVTISAFLMRLFPVIGQVVSLAMRIISDAKSGKDVTSLIHMPTVSVNDEAIKLNAIKSINFSNIGFSYDELTEKTILRSIDFSLTYGKVYALIGRSGAGKSTLVDLLLKFQNPTAGDIFINDVPLSNLSEYEVRKRIILVSQEAAIFDDTVLNNICMGTSATLEEVRRACEIAAIDDVIMQMEHGYETRLQYQGKNLSGGQRQRIAIARAVLRIPDVLILDESTSALDKLSQTKILESLLKKFSDKIIIFITHDPHIMDIAHEVVDLTNLNKI